MGPSFDPNAYNRKRDDSALAQFLSATTPRRLLYVGCDSELKAAVQRLPQRAFEVDCLVALDGACNSFPSSRYAVVIVDWELQGAVSSLQRMHPPLAAKVLICICAERLPHDWLELIEVCDDYFTKPFQASELLTRIWAAVTRPHANLRQNAATMQWGPLVVDIVRQCVYVVDREVDLQPLQVRLLCYLMRHAGRQVSHQELRSQVFRAAQAPDSSGLARQISVLRSRLGAAGTLIVTLPGAYGLGVPA